MLLHGSDKLLTVVARLFTEILQPQAMTPKSWNQTHVTVLFKKGDARLPANYRPISLLPILYKLFSRIVKARIQTTLDRSQTADQAGIRSGYCCDDHLLTMVLIIERTTEFQVPLWVCAVDFQKAFDTVNHSSLWTALLDQGVETAYVRTLAKLYSNQVGRIKGLKVSKLFAIGRGTKQGDPLSPSLFNSLLERALAPVQQDWRRKRFGITFNNTQL
eukprot:8957706-Karenia_brevis.AAC.1